MGSIALEPTPGAPRLLPPAADVPPPRDDQVPQGEPEVTEGPPPPGTVVIPRWTPEQATQMTSAGFGAGGGGLLLYRRGLVGGMKLLPLWYAPPREFEPAAEPLARLWDRVPFLAPGAAGPSGLLADLMAAVPCLIDVGVRHARAVMREIDREERDAAAAADMEPPPSPPMEGAAAASPTYTNPSRAAPAPSAEVPRKRRRDPGAAYHLDADRRAFLESQVAQAADHHGSIRNPQAA